ncbi:MAG: hypothetical protein D6711_15660, partial [Chloroflexi bacterium]
PEITPESTPEATVEPEVTDEPTVDPELTEEPTIDPEVTPEPEPQDAPTLFTDFNGELLGWTLSDGAEIVFSGENGIALLAANTTLAPSDVLYVGEQRIRAEVSIVSDDRVDGVGTTGVSINFRMGDTTGYRLSFELDQTALYRNGELVASVPAAREIGAWYQIDLSALDATITFSVDDVQELTYTDEDAISAGVLNFTANDSSVIALDNVAVYDLTPQGESIEPTNVPFTLDDTLRVKFTGAFVTVLETYMNETPEAAYAIADNYFMPRDEANRFYVEVWAVDGLTGEHLVPLIETVGGVVDYVESEYVLAYLPIQNVMPLAALPEVRVVNPPAMLVSTSPTNATLDTVVNTGTVPHSLDIIGVNDWHLAGALGQGVDILVLDTGFVGATSLPTNDRVCLGSTTIINGAGSNNHGTNVLEVLCDVAPNSDVWLYRVSTATDLKNALNAAASGTLGSGFPIPDVILVPVDDTALGSDSGLTLAVQTAYTNNIVVIASAGNQGPSSSGIFSLPGGTADVTVNTRAGQSITYGWEDNPEGTRNYTATLSSGETILDTRTTRTGEPQHQFIVPASCGDVCTLMLTIEGTDTANITVSAPNGSVGTVVVNNNPVSSPMAITNGMTTVANSDYAIAVGAVCAQPQPTSTDPYPIWSSSSRGRDAGLPTVKPEVVAPTYVRTVTSGTFNDNEVDLCN